ncbi:gliding motility lipoprotein GldH [Myroides oncorhynchi]|uniref:gliding motility lipoprotein GldH n=1 Tax=Myroides oncorhynchi TaxID=2893756 RepID=UPI002106BB39|nr:gliding motility lipoprotein GldH [Myroides oncorhynchi]
MLIQRISRYLIVLSFIIFSISSCQEDSKMLFDQYQETTGTWDKKDVKTFVYDVQDTVQRHNLFMNLRVNKSYPYSNLFVIFKIHQPNSDILIDTLQFQMAKPDGTLLGNSFSDVKESKLELKEGYVFPEAGSYKFSVEQVVRELGEVEGVNSLKGVSEVGFRIEKQ